MEAANETFYFKNSAYGIDSGNVGYGIRIMRWGN